MGTLCIFLLGAANTCDPYALIDYSTEFGPNPTPTASVTATATPTATATATATPTPTPTATPSGVCSAAVSMPPFVTGSSSFPLGTASSPYPVCAKVHMDNIAADTSLWSNHFYMDSDIDMDNAGANNEPIGNAATNFTGTFDGRGKTLSNFKFVNTASSTVGMFGTLGSTGVIKRIIISSTTISGSSSTGGVVGSMLTGATISSLTFDGFVEGTSIVGGIIGNATTATITDTIVSATISATGLLIGGVIGNMNGGNYLDSSGTGTVTGGSITGGLLGSLSSGNAQNITSTFSVLGLGNSIGGIVGTLTTGTISHSAMSGVVEGTSSQVGGIAGQLNASTLTHSSVSGNVISSAASQGGIAGGMFSTALIQSCTFTGTLTNTFGSNNTGVGGMIGAGTGGEIRDSFATGDIIIGGGRIGGLAGTITSRVFFDNSFHTGNVVGSTAVGGLVGFGASVEMKNCYKTQGYVEVATNLGSAGGIFGTASQVSVANTYATVSVADTTRVGSALGGFAGTLLFSTITNSWATGSVTGNSNIGGFAGSITNGNSLINVMANSTVSAALSGAGGLAGRSTAGRFYNSYSLGAVEGNIIGSGITLFSTGSRASFCYTYSSVIAESTGSGGFAGSMESNSIASLSYSAGHTWTRANATPGGGFVGSLTAATITNSAAYGDVSATTNSSNYGGFAGNLNDATSTLIGNFSVGIVSVTNNGFLNGSFMGSGTTVGKVLKNYTQSDFFGGINNFGGLGSTVSNGVFSDFYSTSQFSAALLNSGGILGTYFGGATFSNLYYDGDRAGDTRNDIAFISTNDPNMASFPTTGMAVQANFVGFDFANDWVMPLGADGNGPPKLRVHYFCFGGALADAPYANSAAVPAGTREDPIQICTATQFAAIQANPGDWDKYFLLGEDLHMNGAVLSPIGTSAQPFSGTFDGRGHTISHFQINSGATDDIGLFGFIQGDLGPDNVDYIGDGTVQHLTVHNSVILGQDNVGAVVGTLGTGRVLLVNVTGTTTINGSNQVGGVVGISTKAYHQKNSLGAITDMGSYIQRVGVGPQVTITGAASNAGGIVGSHAGKAEYTYFHGTLNGGGENGGVAGLNSGLITDSFSTAAAISIAGNTGGLVGNNTGTVTFSYSGGPIPGLIGANTGAVSSSFYDNDVDTNASAAGTGETTANMSLDTTFISNGWSTGKWVFRSSYPELLSE